MAEALGDSYAKDGILRIWSQQQDLNPRPPVYKTIALPLSYAGNLVAAGWSRTNCLQLMRLAR